MHFSAGKFLIRLVMIAYPFNVCDAYYRTALEMETTLLDAFVDATASFTFRCLKMHFRCLENSNVFPWLEWDLGHITQPFGAVDFTDVAESLNHQLGNWKLPELWVIAVMAGVGKPFHWSITQCFPSRWQGKLPKEEQGLHGLGSLCLWGSWEPWAEPPLSWGPGLGMAEGLRIAPGQASLEWAFKVISMES